MTPEPKPDWEQLLKSGLDAVSDLKEEAPPSLAALQMLAVDVQREQRKETVRDLVRFLAVAAVILAGVLFVLLREPVYFFIAQGILVLGLLISAAVYAGARGRVME